VALYYFQLRNDDGSPGIVLGKIAREPWARPRLGQLVRLRNQPYKITETIPVTNSEDDPSVTYVVDKAWREQKPSKPSN
jgi:hypothetical protein